MVIFEGSGIGPTFPELFIILRKSTCKIEFFRNFQDYKKSTCTFPLNSPLVMCHYIIKFQRLSITLYANLLRRTNFFEISCNLHYFKNNLREVTVVIFESNFSIHSLLPYFNHIFTIFHR